MLGQVVVLNGAPRSGKTSVARAIQDEFEGIWMNLGVDCFKERVIPEQFSPSIGLRPGGEAPELEDMIATIYRAMYDSIAAHSRHGLNVAVDVGHHDSYSRPLGILKDAVDRLAGIPVVLVGVRCPIEVILERRKKTWGQSYSLDGAVPDAVQLWQVEVHNPGIYDLEVDTSRFSPQACAQQIMSTLKNRPSPSAVERIAALGG